MFGPAGNPDPDECRALLRTALDAGINVIETVDAYGGGEAEATVGRALAGRRDEIILMASCGPPMGQGPNRSGGSRRWIVRACEASLRRLGTDHVDVYQLHRPDPSTDIDITLSALSDLVRQGKARAIGTSTWPAEAIVAARHLSDERGYVRPMVEQPPYSLVVRGIEADVLPVCADLGIGVVTWGPLNGGWLTGKYRRGEAAPKGSRIARRRELEIAAAIVRGERIDRNHGTPRDPANALKLDALAALGVVAAEAGMSLHHLAMGFVSSHVAVAASTIGPRTINQLNDYLAAPTALPADVLDAIDAIVSPGLTLNQVEADLAVPALEEPTLRRRPFSR